MCRMSWRFAARFSVRSALRASGGTASTEAVSRRRSIADIVNMNVSPYLVTSLKVA